MLSIYTINRCRCMFNPSSGRQKTTDQLRHNFDLVILNNMIDKLLLNKPFKHNKTEDRQVKGH